MSSRTSESGKTKLSSVTAETPFGYPLDPSELHSDVLTTPFNVIRSTAYLLSSTIFNYALPGEKDKSKSGDAKTDSDLFRLWTELKRGNIQGQIPDLYNLDVTSGCGSILLGYLGKSLSSEKLKDLTVFGSTALLENLASCFVSNSTDITKLPISFEISTVDYDFKAGRLVSGFTKALTAAKLLRLPVLVSSSPNEAQYFTVLSSALAKLGIANVHLFGGVKVLRTSRSISGVLSRQEIANVESKLIALLQTPRFFSLRPTKRISESFQALRDALGVNLAPFTIYGNTGLSVKTLFVVCDANETTSALFEQIGKFSSSSASIIVKSPSPFDSQTFNEIIGSSFGHLERIVVVSQALNGISHVKLDVQASLYMSGNFGIKIDSYSSSPEQQFEALDFQKLLHEYAEANANLPSSGSLFRFIFSDDYAHITAASNIAFGLSMVPGLKVQYQPIYDNYAFGGLFVADIKAGRSLGGQKDLIFVQSFDILNQVRSIDDLKTGGTVVVLNPVGSKLDLKNVEKDSLSSTVKRILAAKKATLKILDMNAVGKDAGTKGLTTPIAINVAFWTFAYPEFEVTPMVNKIWNCYGPTNELLASVILNLVNKVRKSGFQELPYSNEWLKDEKEDDEKKDDEDTDKKDKKNSKTDIPAPADIFDTSFVPAVREELVVDDAKPARESHLELAKKLMFREAYGTHEELRPDEPVQNFVIKVKENKRVTPLDYNRNIFEIEFDISGTGMKYSIGEALGVHGRNDSGLVDKFIKMYGLKPQDTFEIPLADSKVAEFQTRTVQQLLTENVDLFGKPGKKFYESLAEYATDNEQKKLLKRLVAPAGAALLKEYQDEQFFTYADILEKFSSARPSFEDLLALIPPLKRREYSIASSQKMHPNEVHLLVVVVDWVDKQGRKRYGQCSKYLSDLKVGDSIVVSVKPSLMKLPETTTQPIVMAGLGTGLAPFKAFVEERQFQKEHGHEVGEIYLYLGSRHKKQEFLYGEYWQAYLNSHILTYLGAAFSRDQDHKIYIQDRIRENIQELTDLICHKNGHFYLCGPTWPVPDITACLEDVYKAEAKNSDKTINASEEVEKMKEEGRFVLEVY